MLISRGGEGGVVRARTTASCRRPPLCASPGSGSQDVAPAASCGKMSFSAERQPRRSPVEASFDEGPADQGRPRSRDHGGAGSGWRGMLSVLPRESKSARTQGAHYRLKRLAGAGWCGSNGFVTMLDPAAPLEAATVRRWLEAARRRCRTAVPDRPESSNLRWWARSRSCRAARHSRARRAAH